MSIYEEQLWRCLKEKANQEDAGLPESRKCAETYLAGMRTVCDFAVDRAKTIRDIFPMYTLHDETHICNVMQKMAQLLGEEGMKQLSRDEAAMLILAACCHDLGMSCSKDQKLELENDPARLEWYYEEHPGAYVRMKRQKEGSPLPDDLLRDFLRSVHHERVGEVLEIIPWPEVLDQHHIPKEDLEQVCRSHGADAEAIMKLDGDAPDLRMCAILLRLADILDFDASRSPYAVYEHCGFHSGPADPEKTISREEWKKHRESHGFTFHADEKREYPYELPYSATCTDLQIEQTIKVYLDWVDRELSDCLGALRYCTKRWRELVLPRKISRKITPRGYETGEFRFTLDQDRVLELLVGDNLYQDPGVFVRELVQNSIDAVRTRREMAPHLQAKWKPQINIRSWMDEEGYHWFRIEDNGTGMNRDIVEKYFLKVGRSYYASDEFQRDKYRNEVEPGYQPISRFGIGILSCFMGDRENSRVEVSTLHYEPGSDPLRMSLPGLTGYYQLARFSRHPTASAMEGRTAAEKKAYRSTPGTSIAVRTNLYRGGSYRSFREILDRYVVFPEVPIHYEDEHEHESYDYPTEQMLMAAMHAVAPSEDPQKVGVLEFHLTQEQIQAVESRFPGLTILEPPKAVVKCVCLDRSRFLSGAVLLSKLEGGKASCRMQLGGETMEPRVEFSLRWEGDALSLRTELVFSNKFNARMHLLRQRMEGEKSRLHEAGELDGPDKAILDGLLEGYDMEEGWYEYLQDIWGCTRREILNRIASIQKIYDLTQADERRMLEAYQNCSKDHETRLCDLGGFEWYRSFWKEPRLRVGKEISVAAHNGVRCSDAEFLAKTGYRDRTQAILLLKDRYRPELDVSRTKLRSLPLAAQLELAVLRREWELEGFSFDHDALEEMEYWRIPCSRYYEVLAQHPELEERLRIETDHGMVSLKEIPELLRRFPEIKIQECPALHSSGTYYSNRYLHEYCILACLRREYVVLGKDGSLWLQPASAERSRDWEEFPPSFFLPAEGKNGKLTRVHPDYRYYCNEAHPLSIFLLRNRAWLEKHTPGLLREIMESLAKDYSKWLIPGVNRCLERLREFRGEKPQIPDDAFLTEKDFWR